MSTTTSNLSLATNGPDLHGRNHYLKPDGLTLQMKKMVYQYRIRLKPLFLDFDKVSNLNIDRLLAYPMQGLSYLKALNDCSFSPLSCIVWPCHALVLGIC